ncbi:HAMP domain-containing histidine kinase [Streptomonospora sp. PA3]|nr:HAMP domain-containing histidine kinase [Streptomonospora sp. PA3]
MVWVVLLMFGVLALVNLVTWQTLRSDAHARIDTALAQEIDEFHRFAAKGHDRRSGEPIADVHSALRAHIIDQHPDADEIIFGHVDEAPGAGAATGRVRQAQEPHYDVSADDRLRARILTTRAGSGQEQTPAGPLRWHKIRVEPRAGSGSPGGWFVIGYFVEPEMAGVHRTMRTLLLVSTAGLVLAGAAAWWVAGRILAPVRLVRQAAAQISEEDLTRRIEVTGNDDIAALAEQFNGMLDRLEQAFSTQRRFVDDAGHELRTPITIVRGHLELMGDDPDERREVVRLVTDELDRMARIVEDLLLLAKAQRPDFVRPEEVWLAELTGDIEAKVRALGERDWRLEHVAEGAVLADPQLITQAMVQLASNAVRHTRPGDTIRIGSAMSPDGSATLWVADSGPGIPPEEHERIFERFSRGSASAGRPGAGLGLAIVRAIADAHHGRAAVHSAPGQGAVFTLTLPAGPRREHP